MKKRNFSGKIVIAKPIKFKIKHIFLTNISVWGDILQLVKEVYKQKFNELWLCDSGLCDRPGGIANVGSLQRFRVRGYLGLFRVVNGFGVFSYPYYYYYTHLCIIPYTLLLIILCSWSMDPLGYLTAVYLVVADQQYYYIVQPVVPVVLLRHIFRAHLRQRATAQFIC